MKMTDFNDRSDIQTIITYYYKIQVNLSGDIVVTDRHTGLLIDCNSRTNERGEKEIELQFLLATRWVRLAVLSAFAFKGMIGGLDAHVDSGLIYCDDNPGNIHPSNLIWAPNSVTSTQGGFRMIPGRSRYLINRAGSVYNLKSGEWQSPYVDDNGYVMYGVTPDVGTREIIGRHRLMALAFLPYDRNVDTMRVNHANGIKGDDRLDNLEWNTPSENNQHAYNTGLRNLSKRVLVRNVFTKEVIEYQSVNEAARALNITAGAVTMRCSNNGKRVYEDGTQLKYDSSTVPWRHVENPEDEVASATKNLKVKLTHAITGEVNIFDMQKDAAIFLGIGNKGLSKRMRKGLPCNYGHYQIDKL